MLSSLLGACWVSLALKPGEAVTTGLREVAAGREQRAHRDANSIYCVVAVHVDLDLVELSTA